MTSTSPDSSPESVQTNKIASVLQPILQLPIVQRLHLGSIGTRLFISVMGGAMVGMGGMAFLFGEVVKFQAESEIQQTVADKADVLGNSLGQAEILAETFRTSILTLHKQRVKTPEVYRNLAFELFKSRPDFVLGLGLGQSENGILSDQEWFFSYYTANSDGANVGGKLLSPPYNDIRYSDGTESDIFYPETDRYKNYFLPQKDIWSIPNANSNQAQLTYYSQIFADQNQWLGTVFVDLDPTILKNTLNDSALSQAGFFALLTTEGQIIAYPPTATTAEQAATDRTIPGLASVWSKIRNGESGLVEGDRGYWAYARVPESDWITIAFVPYRAVFSRVALITVAGTITVGLLLAIVVMLTVRYLNYRLRPILQECNRLATTDTETLTLLQHQDEIGQLSIAFFNLLEQIKTNEEQIHQEVCRSAQAEAQLKQAEVEQQTGQMLQTELSHLFTVLSAVEQGDLTLTAQANSPLTGGVAETLNRLIERLAEMIAIVLNTTQHVAQGAADLEQLAIAGASKAQQQSRSVVQVQTVMANTSQLSQHTALQAVSTNEAVQLAQSAITQGQHEITAITQGIAVLEQGTDQMVKRTQTLTNYVELASQFAKDQKRIAAMTRILAVNASMLASRASAQQDPEQLAVITREFETIAAQVNTLASQTNQSLVLLQQRTDQIQTVVSGLNHDVQEISQQVNTFTVGVDQSRQAFDTLKTVNDRIAQMGQRVVQSSQTIADTSQLALASIEEIATIASTTQNQADTTQEQTQQIEHLAHSLLHHFKYFQLPEERAERKDEG